MTTSQPRALPATTASKVTPAGSPPSWLTISICPVGAPLRRAGALGPGEQLLARGGAEGVGGGEQHLLLGVDAGGAASLPTLVVLPAPLTPTTMITVGVVLADHERPLERLQQLLDALGEQYVPVLPAPWSQTYCSGAWGMIRAWRMLWRDGARRWC